MGQIQTLTHVRHTNSPYETDKKIRGFFGNSKYLSIESKTLIILYEFCETHLFLHEKLMKPGHRCWLQVSAQ